jgi:hypothetical protein
MSARELRQLREVNRRLTHGATFLSFSREILQGFFG